jgi:hypothetical protein
MVLAAILAAYFLVHLDDSIGHEWTRRHPLLFGAGADGARGMLSAIAGSMITVAGLIFSLTLSTLAQVSSQYTSRLLRNFMRDRSNQVVMGFFVSIFVYCLAVLRTIRGGEERVFVPSLAVAFGLLLALVSIGMLIFFIHHIASSIQAANVIGGAAQETEKTFDKLFPKELGDDATPAEREDLADLGPLSWAPITARATWWVSMRKNCWPSPKKPTPWCGWSTPLAATSPKARCWCRWPTAQRIKRQLPKKKPTASMTATASATSARSTKMPVLVSANWSILPLRHSRRVLTTPAPP